MHWLAAHISRCNSEILLMFQIRHVGEALTEGSANHEGLLQPLQMRLKISYLPSTQVVPWNSLQYIQCTANFNGNDFR